MAPPEPQPVCLADYEALARRAMAPAAFDIIAGGAQSEQTLRANDRQWSRVALVPRVLVDVGSVVTTATVLAHTIRTPFLVVRAHARLQQ